MIQAGVAYYVITSTSIAIHDGALTDENKEKTPYVPASTCQ
jgi:hypothetical protein